MSKKRSVKAVTAVSTKADEIRKKVDDWIVGAYKRSNQELYGLLDECLKFYLDLKGDKSKCKALNDYLRNNDIAFTESSGLATRVVRAVFNSDFQKRAYGYARVIKVAADEKKPSQTMADFISKRGGVEELRRAQANGRSPAATRQDNICFAKTTLNAAEPLTNPIVVNDTIIKLDEGSEHSLFVAIMRQEADGSYSLVYETVSKSVLNAALALAGKECGQMAAAETAVKKRKKTASDSAEAASNAVEAALAA